MKAGLVGYAQTGKTTLFSALTGLGGEAGKGRKANLGVVKVPDERVRRLSEIYDPKKTTFAEVVFVDVPGPSSKGAGFDAAALSALQEVDALVLVLRGFAGADGGAANPATELEDFETELVVSDMSTLERRMERLRKSHTVDRESAVLERCLKALTDEQPLRSLDLSEADEKLVAPYALLSRRPLLVVLNTEEGDIGKEPHRALADKVAERGLSLIGVCAPVEAEIARLPEQDRAEFLAGMGIAEAASARLIREAYAALDYISFFTVGEDEVRAWTVRKGSKAPRAAGRIHSDLERGFIRAEVMSYDQFVRAGSELKLKELGQLRLEGKDYEVRDGDIMNIRFNV